jgi:hypothetical protein
LTVILLFVKNFQLRKFSFVILKILDELGWNFWLISLTKNISSTKILLG